jgi:sec-independent protein translocase protein TatC
MSVFKNFLGKRSTNPNAEMGFLDHVEDLRWHIIRSAVVVFITAILVFWKVEWIFDQIILGPARNDFISYKWFCALGRVMHYDGFCLGDIKMKFQNTAVTGQFMMSLSVSLMLGFIISFPYILWELWRFVKPALRPSEVKMANGIVFWCSLLFFTGVLFSYYIVAPYTINFFGNYQLSPMFQNIITIDNYYDTMSNMILAMGLVFELPMLVYFLSRIGIITPEFLVKQRRYAILILFILAEIITPPDLFSCLLVFIPLYVLFEISVKISARAVTAKRKRDALNDQK